MYRSALFTVMASIPLAGLWSDTLWADTVELSGGGHLSGKVNRQGDTVIVEVDDEIRVAIQPSRVSRVVDSDQLERYRQKAAAAGNDAELHYELGIWCVTGANVPGESQKYKRFHMERAVELDPEHTKARAALEHVKDRGRWITKAEMMRERGLISVAGRWELPEAVAIEDYQDSANVEAKQWLREVRRLTKNVLRPGSTKARDSLAALQAIDDPLAAEAIAFQLRESRGNSTQSRSLRRLGVKLLGQFRNGVSVEALVRAGIDELDPSVREAALEQLLEFGAGSAVATYLPMLKSNENRLVNRAARALTWFPDPELALTYVDALVTEHKEVQAPGAGMQAGFGGNGGVGMAQGGKAKVVTRELRNPAALTLVKTIEPNVDHGYDEQAWKEHFARQRTAFSGDLRRDP
jgi:hypothetical protein